MSALAPHRGRWPGANADAPSGRGFVALLKAFRTSGGTAPGEILGSLLEEHHADSAASLAQHIDTGQVFGFKWHASLWVPMFQFDADDLSLRSAPKRVRAELPCLWPGWTVAQWFASPHPRLGGLRPADVLASKPDAVWQAAHSLTAVEAFSHHLPPRRREAVAQM